MKKIAATASILFVAVSLYINFSETFRYLSGKKIIPSDSFAILTSAKCGLSALLGGYVHDLYPPEAVFVIAENESADTQVERFYKEYRVKPLEINLYSYPVPVKKGIYNPCLGRKEFELLKGISPFSVRVRNLNIYFVKGSLQGSQEIGLFMYENNLIVSPRDLLAADGTQSS